MTLGEFQKTLAGLLPGKCAEVPYEIFEQLFPPGIEDDRAKGAAYAFAKASGCVIDHQAHKLAVLFVKEA